MFGLDSTYIFMHCQPDAFIETSRVLKLRGSKVHEARAVNEIHAELNADQKAHNFQET